jgi:hypothetical protein
VEARVRRGVKAVLEEVLEEEMTQHLKAGYRELSPPQGEGSLGRPLHTQSPHPCGQDRAPGGTSRARGRVRHGALRALQANDRRCRRGGPRDAPLRAANAARTWCSSAAEPDSAPTAESTSCHATGKSCPGWMTTMATPGRFQGLGGLGGPTAMVLWPERAPSPGKLRERVAAHQQSLQSQRISEYRVLQEI